MTMPSSRLHTVFGAVAAALLAACSEAPPPAVPEPASAVIQGTELRYPSGHPQLTLLKAVEVRPSTAVAIELPARLIWNEARTQRIYAPLAGRVTAIRADVGQAVKAGTVLASLASPDLGQAQADAARAGVDMQLATKTLKRQRELLDAGVLARKEYDQAEADLARAQAEATRTEARTRLYGGGTGVNQQLAITAGINLAAEALYTRAAKLPRIDLQVPPSVIGRNTIHAMQSGLLFGYVSMVEGMVARFRSELGSDMKVIATGGLAEVVAKETKVIDVIAPWLTLDGLRLIWELNQ